MSGHTYTHAHTQNIYMLVVPRDEGSEPTFFYPGRARLWLWPWRPDTESRRLAYS